jgi:hypothetical protein
LGNPTQSARVRRPDDPHREAPEVQLDHDRTSHTAWGVAVAGVEVDDDSGGASDSACDRTDQREREREHGDSRTE